MQAELRMKSGPAHGGPQMQQQNNPLPPKLPSVMERAGPGGATAAISRNPSLRHPPTAAMASRTDQFGGSSMPQSRDSVYGIPSPQFQATPQSHVSSPSQTKSPGFAFQGAISPIGMDRQTQQHARPQILPQPKNFAHAAKAMGLHQPGVNDPKSKLPGSVSSRSASAFYPSPFHKPYDQLGRFLVFFFFKKNITLSN